MDLEAHVRKAHGELTPVHYAEVNLAARFETTALIAQRLVAADPELPAAEILSLLKTITWASQERQSGNRAAWAGQRGGHYKPVGPA